MQEFSVNAASWSETFGPVSIGFAAKIFVKVDYNYGNTIKIYVSKNGGPFVYKGSDYYMINF